MNTIVLVGSFALFIGFALWRHRQGKKSSQRDYMEDVLDDLDEAQRIRRDAELTTDPGKRLREEWSRPVLQDRGTDSDQ